ncbi:MAG TPA: hypothetical protein PK808_03820 [Polymorphobacter sp.]|nr:hypothetical protein [Polymorphobacter sp.]
MFNSFGRARFVGNGALIGVAMLAALGCYTISLKVSSERAAVDNLRAQVVADAHDIRMLQSELRTRARLPELQRWNDTVLALSPPSAQQFVRDGVQLASYAPGAPHVAAPAPVAPAPAAAAPATATPAPATAAPLLPATPRNANQLAPGMKTINYAVPAASRPRLVTAPAAVAPVAIAKVPAKPVKASAGLDSSLVETVTSAAAAAPAALANADTPKAPMQ